jgi:hypothetical protein
MMYTVWKIGLTLHLVMESPHTWGSLALHGFALHLVMGSPCAWGSSFAHDIIYNHTSRKIYVVIVFNSWLIN